MDSDYGGEPVIQMSQVEAIRTRPGMYVGGDGFFGLIHYLVCPITLLLMHEPTHISVTVGDGFEVTSDGEISLESTQAGFIPFEVIRPFKSDGSYEGAVLNALSRELEVSITTAQRREELRFAGGERISHHTTEVQDEPAGSTLRFKPDGDIFTVTQISPAIFESYFRRLSFLHAGVRFSLTVGGQTQVFQTENGMVDLFTALSAPYQLMHTPIQFVREEGNLRIQLVMAYHSWKDNHLWSFINSGRSVEGGTHEQGMLQALKRLRTKLELPENFSNGVVAVLTVQYPKIIWRGCVKDRVSNPELRAKVLRFVVEGTLDWLREHPEVASQISQFETFTFPDEWYR